MTSLENLSGSEWGAVGGGFALLSLAFQGAVAGVVLLVQAIVPKKKEPPNASLVLVKRTTVVLPPKRQRALESRKDRR